MNLDLLEKKVELLRNKYKIDESFLNAFFNILKESDPLDLYRINPFAFAAKYNLDKNKTIDIFLYSARTGIFDIFWNLLCPACGSIIESFDTINKLNFDKYHCTLCNLDTQLVMDDYTEISFSLSSEIHVFDLEKIRTYEEFEKVFYSKNYFVPEENKKARKKAYIGYYVIKPRDTGEISFDGEEGCRYRLFSNTHLESIFNIDNTENESKDIFIDVKENTNTEKDFAVSPGKVNIKIINESDKYIGLNLKNLTRRDPNLSEYSDDSYFEQFFTGKMLLNSDLFRKLFKINDLNPDLEVKLRSLTVLFSDLKDSTKLYTNIGDMKAYNLIRQHFKILEQSVREHSGTIIKTMGDSIMATFSDPENGILAALDMMDKMKDVKIDNDQRLELKIGLNEGPSIAINNEGLIDYFGQTINIASRMQNLAEAGEIIITNAIYNQINSLKSNPLEKFDYKKTIEYLKGIDTPTDIYRFKIN